MSDLSGAAQPHDVIVREAIVLAGGEATRLGEIAAAVPKCLQPVAGRPFIDYLLRELRRHGVRRVVLATGRLHDAVEQHVGDGAAFGLEVDYSLEPEPLGTAGAVALAARHLTGHAAYVCNGDSLLDCNLLALAGALNGAPDIRVAVALHRVPDTRRFGAVTIGADGLVTAFCEKTGGGPGLVNGGIYCARAAWLRELPPVPSSLERDVFPPLVAAGSMAAVATEGLFIDIGLPESLADAQQVVQQWRHRPCAFLDRDGVINVDTDYVHTPAEFRFMPGMPEAIRALNDAGWLAIVITNQAGIGRGYYTEADFAQFTAWIDERLAEAGAHVDATYHCPHHPTAGVGDYLRECECRKPKPGMLLRAIDDWEPDTRRSFMLGDMPKDLAAAEGAGIRGVRYDGGDLAALVRDLMDEMGGPAWRAALTGEQGSS